MNPIHMVFSDIDGTLLNTRHQLTGETIRGIRALDRLGVPFVLVSSRPPGGILPLREALGVHAPLVAFGGGLILGADSRSLLSLSLPPGTALEVHQAVLSCQRGMCCCAYSYLDWLVEDPLDPWVLQEQEILSIAPIQAPLEEVLAGKREFHKLLCMGSADAIRQLEEDLRARFPSLAVIRSKDTYLEITHPRATKSGAVRFLCEFAGIAPEQTLSFGDNYNDLDMLEATGTGIAMGNAPEDIRTRATAVTLDNDHDGVARALGRYFPLAGSR